MQVTGNVLQGHVSDPRAPGQVQTAELTQVLSNQLHTIISDLGAAREAEGSQVGKAVHHVDHTVIGDLPAGVKPQSVGGVALQVEGNFSLSDYIINCYVENVVLFHLQKSYLHTLVSQNLKINLFKTFSGYRLNSKIRNLPPSATSLNLAPDKFKYLQVAPSEQMSDLFKLNFISLLNQTNHQMVFLTLLLRFEFYKYILIFFHRADYLWK